MQDYTPEKIILSSLLTNDTFTRKALPYMKSEYFLDKIERGIFETINRYMKMYNTAPSKSILCIETKECESINEKDIDTAIEFVHDLFSIEPTNNEKWLLDTAEEFCRSKSIYNAIMKSISIYDGTETKMSPHSIPDLMKDSLSISFDSHVGMDFIDDAEERWKYYTSTENKLSFDIAVLNEITNGGVARKTLSIIMGGIHSGKTMSLAHLACGYNRCGYNVLYITMEMREELIFQRIDSNLLQIQMDQLSVIEYDQFINKIDKIKMKAYGKTKVKEFAPGCAHTGHFRQVLQDLELKQRFKPDVIMVDYIGITASSKLSLGQQNSYFYLKSVSEEIRALAVETDTAIWSAMQLNRTGMSNTDHDMTDVSESLGILMGADLILSIIRTEELDKSGQVLIKQQKNRFAKMSKKPRFVVGVDLDVQTLYDLDNPISRDSPVVIESEKRLTTSDTKSKLMSKKERLSAIQV